MGYYVVRSYERLISSEITFWSAKKCFDGLVFQQSDDDILLLCVLYIEFTSYKRKGLLLLTTG